MILQLSISYTKPIAGLFATVFSLSLLLPGRVNASDYNAGHGTFSTSSVIRAPKGYSNRVPEKLGATSQVQRKSTRASVANAIAAASEDIGGPSQPEMSSFKSAGTDNMVNLFTGDFSYNIPLIDVGGYPVNIYYDGGVTMEQEASWVGLGWNINPGNINRNMRGIPDDFNGRDTLTQVQAMKTNKTWGLGIGADFELMGIKSPVNAELGMAFNNYLGPSLDFGIRGTVASKMLRVAGSEKITAGPRLNLGVNVNSRSGTSFSGSLSLTSTAAKGYNSATFGVGLSTGYNSRTGIQALQISSQSYLSSHEKKSGTYKKSGEGFEYIAEGSINPTLYSTSISFVKPSYVPALRMPLTNTAWSGHFQLGLGSFGVATDVEAEVYGQKSEIAPEDVVQKKPMVGYMYYENAVNNPDYVMDFTRFNDQEVTPNTPIISVPQYSYDVFSIQGEGTGGSIRAFRNDLGYVRDNITTTKDKNTSLGGDVDPPGHYGGNFNMVKTPSTIGEWNVGNKLRSILSFKGGSGKFENVYFRNPGENCVVDPDRLAQVGGTDLVRFALGGSGNNPTIEPKLQSYGAFYKAKSPIIDLTQNPVITKRNKRTQFVHFLTAEEAAIAGLDKVIKNYNNQTYLDPGTDTLIYQSIPRVDGVMRKSHHLSEINVTENNGKRYVYGIPVYNNIQKDFVFSVDNSYTDIPDVVDVTNGEASESSSLLNDNSKRDGYVQITSTPAYAHSFLLSGILSPDYVDVTGNGITDDDLGNAVKFNYNRVQNGTNAALHKWRTPLTESNTANFNAGALSEVKDDKGIISYGERESWYLQSIESKTMIAFFYLSNRLDGKGADGINGGVNSNDYTTKKLDSIALFSKSDVKTNGLSSAKPIKTVHFEYAYQLCQNTPDNPDGSAGDKGKLTLKTLYFTYNGKTRAAKNKYSFSYASNPVYAFAASDRWGTYKPENENPAAIKNSQFPYSLQDKAQKAVIDQQASAWMLKTIVLPSGGQIDVDYESDDYAFVQNKRAAIMMNVAGFGSTPSFSSSTNQLYPYAIAGATENDYVFVHVPVACANATEVYNRYLSGVQQLAFKINVKMPKGYEYITCYANIDGSQYGVDAADANVIWIKMKRLAGKSPLSLTVLEFLRQQLPGQAYDGYDISGDPGLQQVGEMLLGMMQSLKNAFTDPVEALRNEGKAMHTDLSRCFVRLNDPDAFKYGGGYRVKTVTLKDNWNAMTGQYTSSYGQRYDYTTTENFNGSVRTISSGVASYEPSIGGEENPWQTIVQVQDDLPAGPSSFGAVEMPVLDAFFPSPIVGYSKITVSSLRLDTSSVKKSRSGIGKQVTEYYTAKDFPVYYDYTPFDAAAVKEFHQVSTLAFFNKYAYDYKAQSQGFLVATNDMHGKLKSQSSYAENDTATRISYTENFYKNTGTNGSNDQFLFISKENKGDTYYGKMGIDIDLMTDTREFAVKSSSMEVQGQVDIFYFLVPVTIPTIWNVNGEAENIYRAVTTTKTINYHGFLDSVIVIDKGSQVSTKNVAYDEQTGEVLVTRTNNEFDKPIYSASYPAYWAYKGMEPAYENTGTTFTNVNFSDGKVTNVGFDLSVFASGDELLIYSANIPTTGCESELTPGNTSLVWVLDRNKNKSSLPEVTDFIFLNADGKPVTMSNVSLKIIRSGHRNLLDAKVAVITSMSDPLATGKLTFSSSSKVINASAQEFREKWQVDDDVIKRLRYVNDENTCTIYEVEDPNGYLEKSINPYRKGLLGNFHTYRNMVFYDNRKEYDTTSNTNIAVNGYLDNFKLYWNFDAAGNLLPDSASTQWVWNTKLQKINAKGLELETQDALGIYTSAQYGFNKSLPVAIANNARYEEMFAEGFEDYGYGGSLENTHFNLGGRHLDFSKMTGAVLVNTDSTAFKAHTGKNVLAVTGTGSLTLPVSVTNDSFNLKTSVSNLQSIVKGPLGGIFGYTTSNVKLDNPNTVYNEGNPLGGVYYRILPYMLTTNPPPSSLSINYNYRVETKQYFEVSAKGTYTFKYSANNAFHNPGTGSFPQFMSISIYDSVHQITYTGTDLGTTDPDNQTRIRTKSYCLDKGIYIMNLTFYTMKNYTCSMGSSACALGGPGEVYLEEDHFSIYDSNTPSSNSIQFFRSYTTVTQCPFTQPISGTDSMRNAGLSITTAKPMVFSAWVHEQCGNAANGIPCKENTYTHNQVQLQFNGGSGSTVSLDPSGPIIDGWQRYEGYFTAPSVTTDVTLKFVNSGTGTIYFDDIRMHPFNSNMKSYVYDQQTLKLLAELDANNYATFYEYDEEGTLIRTKAETRDGIKTVSETRSGLQKAIQ